MHHEQGLPPTITFEPLWNLDDLNYAPLNLKCTSSMLSHHLEQHSPLMQGFTKLLTHGLFAASPTTSGYTWLELLLLSISLTYAPLTHIRSNTARTQKPLVHQIREFAASDTTILKFMLKIAPQTLFQASTKLPNRMRTYGHFNRITHTSAHIQLPVAAQRALHVLMLSLKQPLSKTQAEAFEQDRLVIKTTKFSGHHLIRGTSALMALSECMKAAFDVQHAKFVVLHSVSSDLKFFCPAGHPRSAFDQFDPHNYRKSVWCSECAGCHSSSSWRCPCERAWQNCPDHFPAPIFAFTRPAAKPRVQKRPPPASAQSSASKLARLEPSYLSRPILSEGLAKRFPHLVGQATVKGSHRQHIDDDEGPGHTPSSGSGAQDHHL